VFPSAGSRIFDAYIRISVQRERLRASYALLTGHNKIKGVEILFTQIRAKIQYVETEDM
jgi:hypothetical protein